MKSFRPNCTLPPEGPTFVSGVNVRSTLDIVWSCLVIILLSTWSVLHLNVPPQIRSRTWRERLMKTAWLTWRKVKWMLWGILAPELILHFALERWSSARENERRMREFVAEDGGEWTLTHGFFAGMGGFAIHFPPAPTPVVEKDEGALVTVSEARPEMPDLGPPVGEHVVAVTAMATATQTTAPEHPVSAGENGRYHPAPTNAAAPLPGMVKFAEKQAHMLRRYGSLDWKLHPVNCAAAADVDLPTGLNDQAMQTYLSNMYRLCGSVWILNARQLAVARRNGIISSLPAISEDQLTDKSKSDGVVHVLAVAQLLWLVVQLVVRAVTGRPVSVLEITALSYAVSSGVIYVVVWSQPKDVSQPVVVAAARFPSPKDMREVCAEGPATMLSSIDAYTLQNDCYRYGKTGDPLTSKLRHWSLSTQMTKYGLFVGALLFGMVHMIAWDFGFPTPIERLLWRVCSLGMVASPLVCITVMYLDTRGQLTGFGVVLAFVPVVLQLFIVVETVRSLYFMPSAAYMSTWAVNIPHLG